MIYKNKDGGVVKLQSGGTTVPNLQEIILKTGTKQRAIEEAQKKAKEQVASEKPKYTFVNPYDYTRGGREATEDAAKQDKYTVQNLGGSDEEAQKAYDDTGKNSRKQLAATTTQGLLMAPMLGEFGTYGLLGGGLRIGAGIAGSKAGEYVLGKGGDGADKQLNTNFLGTTGRIIGGLGGGGGGSSATTPLLRTMAGKGITFHMPQETFSNLRGQYFDRTARNIKLDDSVLPKLQYHDRLMKDYLEFGPNANIYGDDVSKLVHGDPMTTGTKSALPINGGFNRDPMHFPHFENGKLVPAIGEIQSKMGNGQMYKHPYHPIFFGGNKPGGETRGSNLSDLYLKETTFDKSKFTGPKQYYNRGAKRTKQNLRTLRNGYEKYGPQNKSDRYLITDPENLKDYEFSYKLGIMGSEVPMSKLEGFEYDPLLGTFKRARYIDPSTAIISPQEAATTYHFDGRMPLSRPISEFERNGKYTLDELHQMGFKLPRKHLQGDDAVKMFKEYGTQYPEKQDTPLMQQLRKYVPEARERYGLVGNTNITDDEIAGSLYKKILELGEDTAARNEAGEPLILFRGDTKRYNALRKVVSPEELKNGRGSMDNSFGNLFLGQLDRPGEGVERYIHYVHQSPSGATDVYPSATGERLIGNGNKIREQGAPIYIPEKYLTYDLRKPFKRYGEQVRVRKISSELASPNSNDINAFVVRTPAVRNSSSEISPETGGEFINVDGVPKFKNSNYIDREHAALRIRQILDDAELKNQGLLKSDAYSPLRENEHFEYDYYALPNFNIRGAKHILPFDLRIPTQGNSRIIYRKQGGIIKVQNGFLNTGQKAYNSKFGKGLRDFMFGKDRDLSDEEYFEKYGYNKPVGSIGVLGALVAPEWEGLEIPEITAQHIGNQGKVLRGFESGNSKMLKVPVKETSKKTSNGQRFLKLSQQEQDDFVRRGNGESFQGFATLKGDEKALGRFRSGINSRK